MELRLAGVLVQAFAESSRPSVNEYQNKQAFVLAFVHVFPSILHSALPGIDNFPYNLDHAATM